MSTWDGGGANSDWNNGANWDPDGLPFAGGIVTINGAGGGNANPTISTATTYVFSVEISGGTVAANATLTASFIMLSGTGTLTINAAGNAIGNIEVRSGGTLNNKGEINGNLEVFGGTANNAGVVSGNTTVNSGTLSLYAGTNLSDASAVRLSGGILVVNAADTVASVEQSGGTLEGAATLSTKTFAQSGGDLAGTVLASGAKTLFGGVISGTLDGAGATTIQTGTTTVTGTIVGDVNVAGSGTLRIASATAVSGTITTTGSTVSYANGINEGSALVISSATTDLEVLGTDAAEQSGSVSSTGVFGFKKVGAGNLTLSGANTYTGETTVSKGTLTVAHSEALGIPAAGTTVATGASLAVQGNSLFVNETLTLSGGGVGNAGALINQSGNNFVDGAITLAGATRIQSDSGLLAMGNTLSGAFGLTFAGSGDITLDGLTGGGTGIATGKGGVVKEGSGSLLLSATNTYTGTTTVNGGVMNVTGSIASLSNIVNAGSLQVWGPSLDDAATVTLNFSGNLTLRGSETIGALVSGSATSAVLLGINTLKINGDADGTTNEVTTFAGVISGSGGLTKSGSDVQELKGANTYTGATSVESGGVLRIANGAALGATGAGAGTTVASGAALELTKGISTGEAVSVAGTGIADGGAIRNISADNAITGAITLTGATRMNADAGDLQLSGGITGANQNLTLGGAGNIGVGSITTGTGTLTKDGSGTLALLGINTFTGATTVNAGTLQLVNAGGTLSDTALLTVNAPGRVMVIASETVGNIAGSGLILVGGATLTAGNAGNSAFSGSIQDNAVSGAFTKTGTGTLTLSGANTYTGTTTVSGGVLDVTGSLASVSNVVNTGGTLRVNGSSIADNAAVTLNGSGILNLAGDEDVGALISASASAAVSLGAKILTVLGSQSTTYAGTLAGTGTFLNEGKATLTLTGNGSAFTGILGAIGKGSALALTGTGTTGASGIGATTGNAFMTDGGALLASNAVLSSDGQVTFTGSETIGTITDGGAAGFGNGTITLTGAATVLTVNGSVNPINAGAINGLNGAITGTGSLVKTGAGTLTLAGANTYTGATTVSAGTLAITGAGSIASNSVTVDGGTLSSDGNGIHDAARINLGGVLKITGAETIGALLPTSGASLVDLEGATLVLAAQTGSLDTLTIDGSPGVEGLAVVLGAALANFSLTGINFTNWTAGVDRVSITGNALGNTLTGGTGNDVLVGLGGIDTAYGLNGNDYLYMGSEDDVAVGGAGVDVLLLEGGNDYGYGGDDTDYIFGGLGNDRLIGEGGVDVLQGEAGNDFFDGGEGGDFVYGGEGDDTAYGRNGNDILVMEAGNDQAFGEAGQDYFYMGAGDDSANGGEGVDVFLGGAGNDVFEGGTGVDYAWGEAGNDAFLVRRSSGVMVVQDFTAGGAEDAVRLTADTGITSLAQALAASTYFAGLNTTIVTVDADTAVWLVGVNTTQLTSADFQFVA